MERGGMARLTRGGRTNGMLERTCGDCTGVCELSGGEESGFFFPGGAVHWILHSTGLSLCASDAAVDDVPSVRTEVVTSCPLTLAPLSCLYIVHAFC